MAGTTYNGAQMTGPSPTLTIDKPGNLRGFLISHAQATVQTVVFYNNSTPGTAADELLTVHVAPEQSPYYVHFPRHGPIPFSTGLSCTIGNCEVAVWAIKYTGGVVAGGAARGP